MSSRFLMEGPSVLVLCRHGHYPTNDKTFGSWQPGEPLPDIPDFAADAQMPLDELGRQQSQRMGAFLATHYPALHSALSSDWQRAVDTAEQISSQFAERTGRGLTITTDERLQERNRGPYRGLPKERLRLQPDFAVYLAEPSTWAPAGEGETLLQKAQALRELWSEMARLAVGRPLLITTHGEVAGGAAMIAFAGFNDEQLKQPLPGYDTTWMPRTVQNCQASIFSDLRINSDGTYAYRSLQLVDASEPRLRMTGRIPINQST